MGTRGWSGPDVAHAQETFVVGGEADDRAELRDVEPAALEWHLPRPLRSPRQSAVLVGRVQGKLVSLLLKLATVTLSCILLASVKTGQRCVALHPTVFLLTIAYPRVAAACAYPSHTAFSCGVLRLNRLSFAIWSVTGRCSSSPD